ncbi:MAG: tetratricopeptide repeat protein [Zavarzinella sp.]
MDPNRTEASSLVSANATTQDSQQAATILEITHSTRYEIGEPIAAGGMGEVRRATDRVLNREIAVKVLHSKYEVASSTAYRFLDEARITGQLQHPGIPPIHDLGTLADGRPFLAMKLIKGETLDEILKSRTDTTHDRSRLVAVFEDICNAVAYAHAHDVIHRDLKPRNIMVGNFGEVQVMDWGLAKVLRNAKAETLIDPESTSAATEIRSTRDSDDLFTQAGSVLGTPSYMAPEQAIGAVDRIDQQTDVFGLGGILAAILTGRPPYQSKSSETTRQLAAMGKLADCFAALDQCGADPELVLLCKKCLSIEKSDRPAGAAEVAQLVARLRMDSEERARQAELQNAATAMQLVEGRKRRKIWIGLAATLAVGVVLSTGLAIWANQSRKKAELAEQQTEQRRIEALHAKHNAEEKTELADEVRRFLQLDVLDLADPKTQLKDSSIRYAADVKLREVLVRASDKIEGKFDDRPEIEAELRKTLGSALESVGRSDLAVKHFKRLQVLLADSKGPEHPDTLHSANHVAINLFYLGSRHEAMEIFKTILELRQKVLGPDHPDTLWTMNNLANCYASANKRELALELRDETLQRRKAILGPDHPDTLMSMHNLAISYESFQRLDDAITLLEKTLKLRQEILGIDHPDTLLSMEALGGYYYKKNRMQDALEILEKTLTLRKEKLGELHPSTLGSMNALSNVYYSLQRYDDALELREKTLKLQQEKLGEEHPDLLTTMGNLANSYTKADRLDEAKGLLVRTLQIVRKVYGPEDPRIILPLANLIVALRKLKLDDEAWEHIDPLLQVVAKTKQAKNFSYPRNVESVMINYRIEMSRMKKDLPEFAKSLQMLEDLGEPPTVFAQTYNLAKNYALATEWFAAEKLDEKAQELLQRAIYYLKRAHSQQPFTKETFAKELGWHNDYMKKQPEFAKFIESLPAATKK